MTRPATRDDVMFAAAVVIANLWMMYTIITTKLPWMGPLWFLGAYAIYMRQWFEAKSKMTGRPDHV